MKKQITNNGHPVYYKFIDNRSDKTVIFIHGLFSTSSIFRHFLKHIKYNIILVELRGIVYSKCKSPYLQNYIEDIKLILDNEKITKNMIPIGYSLGCRIANGFADKYPEMVEKILMLAPVNRTFKQIGKSKIAKTLINSLGKDFFRKWKEYISHEKNLPFYKLFRLFNLNLLEEAYQKLEFTRKCSIVILNGNMDSFFNFKDSRLNASNIIHETLGCFDHFLFLTNSRIQALKDPILKHL